MYISFKHQTLTSHQIYTCTLKLSVLTAKLIVLPCLITIKKVLKLLKLIKNSIFDFRHSTLTLRPSTFESRPVTHARPSTLDNTQTRFYTLHEKPTISWACFALKNIKLTTQ